MLEEHRTKQTYHCELWRAGASGILETAGSTFLLLIAVRWFEAGPLSKAFVAGAGSLGLLLSPALVSLVAAAGWPTSKAASRVLAGGAASFFLAALLPVQPIYILFSVVAMASAAAIIPLLTQMYQENYPQAERGQRFSRTVMVRIAMAALFSKVAGDLLTEHLNCFPILLAVFGCSLGFASFCLARCPTRPLSANGGAHPLRALRFVRQDHLFRRTLICWMLMGFANLMMLPLRVEYLANPRYNHALAVETIAILTGVIPNIARLILSPIWGYLFDHMNFFVVRVALNIGFAVGILTFFMSNSLAGMICGAVAFGISNAGGDVAWSLWVTKFAPPTRVADYMSVHTSLTGVRGVLAPLCAFSFANPDSLGRMALISSILIFSATLLLVPEIRLGRKTQPASALIEEVSE